MTDEKVNADRVVEVNGGNWASGGFTTSEFGIGEQLCVRYKLFTTIVNPLQYNTLPALLPMFDLIDE